MSEMSRPKHGEFCWMELASSDIESCKPFYAELFGWKMETSKSVPGFEYTEFGADADSKLGGMYQMTEEFCDENGKMMASHWRLYIVVDDVDAAVEKVTELGGEICVPPMDIPNTGRFCAVNDPSGAVLSLITLNSDYKPTF